MSEIVTIERRAAVEHLLQNRDDMLVVCGLGSSTYDVYAAGEAPIDGMGRDALVSGLRDHGHRGPAPLAGPDSLAQEILSRTARGDLVMCLGAGDITSWAAGLPAELDKLRETGT